MMDFSCIQVVSPHAIDGCTAMKARVGKTTNAVDIFLDIDGKTYRMADVSYPDAVKMMQTLCEKTQSYLIVVYVQKQYLDIDQMKRHLQELTLFAGDAKQTKSFMAKG